MMPIKPPVDTILHYGIKRKSGRYPWGSGMEPRQGESGYAFLQEVDSLRAKGFGDTEIAHKMGITTTQLRNGITWANTERRDWVMRQIPVLEAADMTNTAIGAKLGVSEATVRGYKKTLSTAGEHQAMQLDHISGVLKDGVDKTGYLDVGIGVEVQVGISRTKLNSVVNRLVAEEGYSIHEVYVKRLSDPTGSTGTTIKVLTKDPDIISTRNNSRLIANLEKQIDSDGKISNITAPKHVSLDRIHIRYKEQGGEDKDGLIELRPNVEDLDLQNSRYAQVRIAAGDDLFLKGMAAYSDSSNFPDGADIIFNTNKSVGTPVDSVLKKMKDDMDNPFGSTIVRQKGALNIVNEQGEWDTWSSKMSSQFLSKQPLALIKDRLDDTYAGIQAEYDEINSMTNPIVKKHLMDKFSDGLDSKAKHLKAKGLAGTMSHVLLPFPDMKPDEVFAPNYENGSRVALVRHPHGGIFEIPDLVVNNKNKTALSMLGNDSPDAIGIHPSVAQKLSGADFDGDTVLVIPNNTGRVKSSRSLQELKHFDTLMYKVDHKTITPAYKNTQMGVVSNLITDMTIRGASDSELARAVKHSMVVIDSEKHNLDYKASARENGISSLIKKYQSHVNPDTNKLSRSASTIVSRSKRKIDISQHTKVLEMYHDRVAKDGRVLKKGTPPAEIAKQLGISEKTVNDYVSGKVFDPGKYSSNTAQEDLYVEYIKNIMKTKNQATKVSTSIENPKYSREAAKIYAPEVKSLNEKLNTALRNKPRERQAQALANHLYYSNVKPGMDKDDLKKLQRRSLARARTTTGSDAKSSQVKLTETEWEAIQARAVSTTRLKDILNNADIDNVRKLASPRKVNLSSAKTSRARELLAKGYTYSEVANVMGVTTTILREEMSNNG